MRVGIFITVRVGSTRLPRKALLEIKCKPTIEYLIERIKRANNADEIVLCTTTNEEDDELIEIAIRNNISFFRGNPRNIIERHLEAAKAHSIDFIMNVDGDDLFCDPEYIDKMINLARSYLFYDVVAVKALPFGVNSFGYRRESLEVVLEEGAHSSTGWGELLLNNDDLNNVFISVPPYHQINARMTLDYEEDFEFFKRVIEEFNGKYATLKEIVRLLRKKPEIMEINKKMEDVYWENYRGVKIKK